MTRRGDPARVLARRTPATLLAAAALLGAGACAGTAAAGAAPGARLAAAPSPDLGGPDYSGYCQRLGFVRSAITASKEWACVHADNTTSPLDVQAACEFTYTQRPIAALQLSKGVPYTWQCYKAAPGSVVLPPGAGGSTSSDPRVAALQRAVVPTGAGAKIGALLRRGRYLTSFHASGLARLELAWYYTPATRHGHPKAIRIAGTSALFLHASTRTVAIALTSKGRRLLKHARRLRVTGRASYAPNGSARVGASPTFTLRR